MQKKDVNVGNKTANKEERQRKKKRAKDQDQNRFAIIIIIIIIIIILAFAHAWKTKKLFNYVRLVGKMPFFLRNSFLTILMLISRKLVQRRGIGEKCVFFSLLSGRHQTAKVKKSTKSIFTTGLYFLPDSATHISFYYKQHFFRTFANL